MQTPAPFEYERALTIQGAIDSLLEHEDSRIVAGGHSLLPMMKLRLAHPSRLIDINDLTELRYIREESGEIAIGALTRHCELLDSELLWERFPAFRDAEHVIADPVVRNRGTIGGSLCQADAAEDLSAVCAALKGTVTIAGREGTRTVPMSEFHLGPWTTAASRCVLAPAARTRRSSGAPATGRSRPRPPRCGSTAGRSPTPASR
jgi:carbon-monoxide dehydrogenase medium subunit